MQTRLDVINAMIVSTGARPLLAGQDRHPMYMKADQLLTRVTRTVLSMGLWFNTENRVIEPQTNGEILVPSNCLSADVVELGTDITIRGNKLYDLTTGSPYVGHALRLSMRFELPFEEIPFEAQDYIRARAVFEYYLDDNGADPKLSNYRAERDSMFALMWRHHVRSRPTNYFDSKNSTANRLRRGYSHGTWRPN